jgi:hypothetical protein
VNDAPCPHGCGYSALACGLPRTPRVILSCLARVTWSWMDERETEGSTVACHKTGADHVDARAHDRRGCPSQ